MSDLVSTPTSSTSTSTSSPSPPPPSSPTIAIIGGGITGLVLAYGLHSRAIPFTVYEQSLSLRELGIGLGLLPNAIRALTSLGPELLEAFRGIAVGAGDRTGDLCNGDGKNGMSFFDGAAGVDMFRLSAMGPWGVQRSVFLEAVYALLPPETVVFGKRLAGLARKGEDGTGNVIMKFEDGSMAEASGVIGCDGIKSRLRALVLPATSPSRDATFTNTVAYRAFVPLDRAISFCGAPHILKPQIDIGPAANVVHLPVTALNAVNVSAFAHHPEPWVLGAGQQVSTTTREVALTKFAGFPEFSPTRRLMDLLPESLSEWAIFDMADHPLEHYAYGPLCLAGDAAHASSPHHGAGASMGIEDAAVLAHLLGLVASASSLTAAFEAYEQVRLERTQWVVRASRESGEVYRAGKEGRGDVAVVREVVEGRAKRIVEFDLEEMVREAEGRFWRLMKA